MSLPKTSFQLFNGFRRERLLESERQDDLVVVGGKASQGHLPDSVDWLDLVVGGCSLQGSHDGEDDCAEN